MESIPRVQHQVVRRICNIMSGLGFIIMLLGLGLDLLPGSSPGISFPQLMIIIIGIIFILGGWFFKKAINQPRFTKTSEKICLSVLLLSLSP